MHRKKLAKNEDIFRFSMIWAEMYKHHASIPYAFFEEQFFVGDGMGKLGFEMDCGKSLAQAFPDVLLSSDDLPAWKKVLEKIDPRTLGNAIFSQWRYFNHWAGTGMTENDFAWFVLSFTRLAELTNDHFL